MNQEGEYQLRIRHILEDGLGNLRLQFDRLKEKLLREGLFEEHRKRSLPDFARTIGVVTSPDELPCRILQVYLKDAAGQATSGLPSLVQGKEAPTQLLKGIEQASEIPGIELIVLTTEVAHRGYGLLMMSNLCELLQIARSR